MLEYSFVTLGPSWSVEGPCQAPALWPDKAIPRVTNVIPTRDLALKILETRASHLSTCLPVGEAGGEPCTCE